MVEHNHTKTPLYTSSQACHLLAEEPVLGIVLDWIYNYLTKPHKELGRHGPVCPYVPFALQVETLWLAVIQKDTPTKQQIEQMMVHYCEVFLSLEPSKGKAAKDKAIIVVFPGIPKQNVDNTFFEVQQSLKSYYTRLGLTVGEFHQYSRKRGGRNPAFHPHRSPVPMLVIRYLVESDTLFQVANRHANIS